MKKACATCSTGFSEDSIYYRYFSPIKTMPHAKMQEYVNVDYSKALSLVGLVGPAGQGTIIAEARYVMLDAGKVGRRGIYCG
jgi:hypothetical protein